MSNDVLNLSVDINSLTVGEIETVEELTGKAIDQLFAADAPKGKALRALGYIVKKRENPEFTWDDAANLKVTLADDSDEDPTQPAS